MSYELYSWQGTDGVWSFCVLHHTNREKTVDEVFDSKAVLRGLPQLEGKLSKLPVGATVFWVDRLPSGAGPKAKGSERLEFPPQGIVDTVKEYAKRYKIVVDM